MVAVQLCLGAQSINFWGHLSPGKFHQEFLHNFKGELHIFRLYILG